MNLLQEQQPAVSLTEDLSSWLDNHTLVSLLLDVMQTIDLPKPKAAGVETSVRFNPRMVLTLLTYCYATGTYSSQDVESATIRDATARYLCARAFPNWHELRRFRCQNRALVKRALIGVFNRAWEFKMWQARTRETAEPPDPSTVVNAERSRRFEAAAEERIKHAVFLDSLALDE